MTISELIKTYSSKLDLIDIEILLSHVLKKTREFVLAYPEHNITSHQSSVISKLMKRRIAGEPIAYILGHKEFYGLDFVVNKNTLVPRPETELIVEQVIQELGIKNQKLCNSCIVDVGTGSGNIIISTAKAVDNFKFKISNLKFIGIDISKNALVVAKKNAKIHGINKKIRFLQGDLLEPILKSKKLPFDNLIITANLPYLDLGWKNLLKSTETKGLKFEPHIALYSGKDGLNAYRKLATQLRKLQKITAADITVLCEIGHLQKKEMQNIFSFAKNITFSKDLAGKWRVCKISI